ncbi:hypothetical protein PybrP1_004398 [[Pythium] brassicae (nom. inval.)]|nr:hypothetical protein PybrP1_004398 [[Pythium] brassicae (nom. inval.)]
MLNGDVEDLLRATASDAGAVAQYLLALDGDELNGLLDRFATHEARKKAGEQQRGDWLALVQLLLRAESARLRTATRIIQASGGELEGMQWLTEISLGYLGATQEPSSSSSSSSSDASTFKARVQRGAVAGEVRMLLRIVFELLGDGIAALGTANPRKALPQLLALLPILLGVLVDAVDDATASDRELHENIATLLALPWTPRAVPLLLDLLKESAAVVSIANWRQLQETVERMVAGGQELPAESLNPIIRECVLIGSVTGSCEWIAIARLVFRQLPPRLRQEAEFNLQMCLHQSQNAVALVCESIRSSLASESSGVDESELPGCELRSALDWRDVVFLFHALQVSRPILHHRTTSSRIATDASIFGEIEALTWAILRLDLARHQCASAWGSPDQQHAELLRHLAERVTQLLTFGGVQIHSREWKALLLMDFALYWTESGGGGREAAVVGLTEREADAFLAISDAFPSQDALARSLLLAVFQAAPEIRSEMLSSLFEGTKSPERVQVAGRTLDQLFRAYPSAFVPHLHAIQDWLSALFQSHFGSARAFLLMASQLMPVHKDLYGFLMVFLRKLLSVSSLQHQQFAIDMWCSWLEHGLRFDALQEEEIVSVLKNSLQVCPAVRGWTLGRLEQMFQAQLIQLQRSSWEEFHRTLSSEVSQFIRPATVRSVAGRFDGVFEDGDDNDNDDDNDDDDDERWRSPSRRFHVDSLDQFYRQNTSADGAAAVGLVFQKALSCLLSFERAAAQTSATSDWLLSLPVLGADVLRWIAGFVSNRELFFHWISQRDSDDDGDSDPDASSDDADPKTNRQRRFGAKALTKKAMWHLLSRIGVGSALCSVAIEQVLRGERTSSESMWSLLEVQLCLHRLLRKLVMMHGGAVIDVKQVKEYLSSSFYGISSVLDARSAQILAGVSAELSREPSDSVSDDADTHGVASAGLSFDSLLFVLDSCSNNAVGSCRSPVSPAPAHTYKQRASADRVGVLRALLRLYAVVHARVFAGGSAASVSEPRPVFTVYSESLVLKFPKSLRHIVGSPKASRLAVLLDARAAEGLLVRVFAALGRVVDSVISIIGADETDCQVHAAMVEIGAFGVERGRQGGLVALAAVLLRDLKRIIAQENLTKLKVTSAMLAKRLCDLSAEVASASQSRSRAFASNLLGLSAATYDILSEHVVFHTPLLRALLGICLSVHLGKSIGSVVALARKVEGFLLASGFKVALLPPASASAKPKAAKAELSFSSSSSSGSDSSSSEEELPAHPSQRRRLRQRSAAQPATVAFDALHGSADSANRVREFHPQPHLASSDAQSAALQALLALLDATQSTLFRTLSARDRHADAPHQPSSVVTQYVRLSEHVLRALLDSTDASWVTARVLQKLLSVVEWSLRIGRLSVAGGTAASSNSSSKRARGASADWLVDVLDSSVRVGIQGRVWLGLFKESATESSTKTRLSATSLKIDVFLLDVPQLVASFAKATHLSDSVRERIRAMLVMITDHMTPAVEGGRAAASKRHVHMIGVVPIVKKRKRRLRSRHPFIDDWLREEDGSDAYADLEDFIE